jgi:hypothetical protein
MMLLAQQSPAAWAQARKFCIAESGTRKPSPHDTWGRWAHAAAVRLGDEPLDPEAFAPRRSEREERFFGNPVDAAHRLMLGAWLDLPATGWSAACVLALQEALVETDCLWLAKLVRLACLHLGLDTLPTIAKSSGTVEPMPFFGGTREVWRDALAAITALGDTKPPGKAAPERPATLMKPCTARPATASERSISRSVRVRNQRQVGQSALMRRAMPAKIRRAPSLRDPEVSRAPARVDGGSAPSTDAARPARGTRARLPRHRNDRSGTSSPRASRRRHQGRAAA